MTDADKGLGCACRFDTALVSLFWMAAGAGPPMALPSQHADGTPDYGVLVFFVSFILIMNWTLLQVDCFTVDPAVP